MKHYHKNPRSITRQRLARLADTLARLGDLGGVVHNLETDEIIGGNQRMEVFQGGQPEITLTLPAPDAQGTVAHGFILWKGQRFAYRQVRWDENTAAEANIVANIGAGDWDADTLANAWNSAELIEWGLDAETLKAWKHDVAMLGNLIQAEAIDRTSETEDFEVETDDDVLAPFPYFGGKSKVAGKVWARFGPDIVNYVEPFCGSAAVLLQAPYDLKVVTLNDADGFIANFWRAVTLAPDEVAQAADWPVNEIDLFSRHVRLVKTRAEMTRKLQADENYFDAKIAGWWVWGICAWIGGGWCSGKGAWSVEDGQIVKVSGEGVAAQIPHLGDAGRGVNRQIPHLGAGRGVNRQIPYLSSGQQGILKPPPPALPGDVLDQHAAHFRAYMRQLQNKLRRARVCCGDWARVTGDSVTFRHGLTAMFLDPPYSAEAGRNNTIYAVENATVAHDVREWCEAHGDNPLLRIALCGYDGEGHEALEAKGWSKMRWKTVGGYGNQGDGTNRGAGNAAREVIWFSPHCLRKSDNGQPERQ
jgi:site-specific DNA-adenine methylase